YEIDTEKALENWNIEIQENLAIQAQEKAAAEAAEADKGASV
ncbi:MAG: 3-ketosteroid-9-alpha-hydroxylase, partial [Gordonia sp. (in: high G+C Gram-positive bacteria)]|nr:3-ketosteroid-9-alpha-hydroxylase [Gordonia sp. (in: high G+C Gram-positive bacteria)]